MQEPVQPLLNSTANEGQGFFLHLNQLKLTMEALRAKKNAGEKITAFEDNLISDRNYKLVCDSCYSVLGIVSSIAFWNMQGHIEEAEKRFTIKDLKTMKETLDKIASKQEQ